MTWLIGFDCEPRHARAALRIDDGTSYLATGDGRKTFLIESPPTILGWGAHLHVSAAGYQTCGAAFPAAAKPAVSRRLMAARRPARVR